MEGGRLDAKEKLTMTSTILRIGLKLELEIIFGTASFNSRVWFKEKTFK